MSEIIQNPKYIVKYWEKTIRNRSAPILKHLVFYTEETLVEGVRKIRGNYFVFEVGKEYAQKSYFDNIFLEEKLAIEKAEFERLKQKFESNGETN